MRIAAVNQFYPPDVAPTGVALHEVCRRLAARGHEVTVLCSSRSYDGRSRYPARETLDGVSVIRVAATGFGRTTFAGKLCDYASFYLAVVRRLLLSCRAWDLVLTLTTPPYIGLLSKCPAACRGTRRAQWVMDVYPDAMVAHGMLRSGSFCHRLLVRMTRWMVRGNDLVLTLGPDMAERLAGHSSGKDRQIEWVPLWSGPGLAPWRADEPNRLREERGWNDAVVFMYSGNMGLGHRFGEFLAVARDWQPECRARWVFSGAGKRRDEIEQETEKLDCTEIMGYCDRSQLQAHLCSADVHLASLDEDWSGCMIPSKVQNIFAVGKPVVFVGGTRSVIAQWIRESGGGWLVPEGDVEALRKAVAEAMDPEERVRRGRQARLFAEAHFDVEINSTRICDLIEACASQ